MPADSWSRGEEPWSIDAIRRVASESRDLLSAPRYLTIAFSIRPIHPADGLSCNLAGPAPFPLEELALEYRSVRVVCWEVRNRASKPGPAAGS